MVSILEVDKIFLVVAVEEEDMAEIGEVDLTTIEEVDVEVAMEEEFVGITTAEAVAISDMTSIKSSMGGQAVVLISSNKY